jgi:hypothetical protein
LHLGLKVKNRKQVTPNVLSFDPYTQSSQGLLIIFQSDDKAHQPPYPRLELDVLNSSSYHEVSARDDLARPCIASIIRSDPLYCTIILICHVSYTHVNALLQCECITVHTLSHTCL